MLKRSGPWGWTLAVGMLILAGTGAARKESRPLPGLGAFATTVTVTGIVSGIPFTWTGLASFSPTANPAQRTISGTGTFTTGGPAPVPPPIPIPVPAPTPPPTPTPTPTPAHTINVKSFGAVGDGVTDDTASCQRALQSAVAGDTLYLPSGTYKISDWLKANHPPLMTIKGDGPSSVIHSTAGGGLMIGTGGEPGGPVTVTKLKFTGNAGATMKSTILATGGIQVYGPNNCVIVDDDFQDVPSAVFCAGPVGISQGTQITNCRVQGWARVGLFLNGGETVSGCILTQTDPNLNGQATSHGIYSHASNVTVQDCVISNARKYGMQIFSEDTGHAMDNVKVLRCQFLNCHDGGLTLDHSQMGAGDIHNCLIDSCAIKGTYGGPGLTIRNGDGVMVKNCLIDGSPSYGLVLGLYAPYDVAFTVRNVSVMNCTIAHCQVGLETYPSNGGTLSEILIQGATFSSNGKDIQQEGSTAGIKFLP